MRRLLVVAILALCPALALAQATHNAELTIQASAPSGACSDGRLYINSSTGAGYVCYSGTWHTYGSPVGGSSWPLLGGSGCTNPPYSFSLNPTWGLCRNGSTGIKLASDYSGKTAYFATATNLGDPGTAEVRAGTATSYGSFQVTSSDAALRYTTSTVNNSLTASVSGIATAATGSGRVQTPVLSLRTNVTSATFLSFTNVADPTKSVQLSQDSAVPTHTLLVFDSGAAGTDEFKATEFSRVLSDGAGNVVNISADTATPILTWTVTDGTSVASIQQEPPIAVTVEFTDGTNKSASVHAAKEYALTRHEKSAAGSQSVTYQVAGVGLVDNTATTFFSIPLSSNAAGSVMLDYTAAIAGADQQVVMGRAHVGIINTAGVETCSAVTELGELTLVSVGAISFTLTCDTAGSSVVLLKATVDSTLDVSSSLTYTATLQGIGLNGVPYEP